MGTTVSSPLSVFRCQDSLWPRTVPILKEEPNSACPAVAPRVTTTRGLSLASSASSHGRHADTSHRSGFW